MSGEDPEMFADQPIPVRESLDEAWWVLYTRHQHEKVVAQQLRAKGFEIFLPLYESTRRWKDRKKVLSLPLFPCYVFVKGGLDRRLQVVTTPGVHSILAHGDKVAMIPGSEVEAIRRAVQSPCRLEPHPYLKCGDKVRVKQGPLEGIEGILVRKKNVYRLILSVEMVNQSVAIEVDASDIEQMSNNKPANVMAFPAANAEREDNSPKGRRSLFRMSWSGS